ncbi:MAG: plasmid pRiA4b ORF-3 family protein [Clostridia bacterium]|nr:plasmid pRiA4b ORF-3 family protein [Clostridia bacterium]
MKIGCTKKLLDFLDIAPAEAPQEEPLFSFSANLLLLNRRKCIAVINDASCCGFILYGVTAKDKKNIQQKLEEGLRNMLASENYAADVIDRYIADCAFPAAICKSANRSAITRLNQFCGDVERFSGCFEPDDPFQTMLLPKLNDDFKMNAGDQKKDYYLTYEELERLLRERYGRLYHCRAGVFDVALRLKTPCVRRVTIPMDFSMFYVHDVIRQLFLWQNYHLHEFVTKLQKNGRPAQRIVDPAQWEKEFAGARGCESLDEHKTRLSDVFPGTERILYLYDFGDGWEHEISLVRIIEDADIPSPVCESMNGDAPPEDCGGPHGFAELQRILNDPKDPQYYEMLEWSRGAHAYQKNIYQVNSHLRRRYLAGAWDLYYRFVDAYDEEI